MWDVTEARGALASALTDMPMRYGGSERTLEATLLPVAFASVGWNPLEGFAWSFQIPAGRFSGPTPTRSSRSADLVLGRDDSVSVVVESKSLDVDLGSDQVRQLLDYQQAIGAPRALLMNGRHWRLFDESAIEVAEVRVSSPEGAPTLISALEAHVGAGVCPRAEWAYHRAWLIGRRVSPPPLWPAGVELLAAEIELLAAVSPGPVSSRRTSAGAVMLQVGTDRRSILELKANGTFARHENNLRKLDVASDLIAAYTDAHAAADARAVLDVCRRIIAVACGGDPQPAQ